VVAQPYTQDTFCQNAFDSGLGDGEHLNDVNAKKVQAIDLIT
jgi:hypothetical protein